MILKSLLFYDLYKQQATSKKNYYQDPVQLYWCHQFYKNKDSVDPSKLAWVIVFFYYKKQQATSQQRAHLLTLDMLTIRLYKINN